MKTTQHTPKKTTRSTREARDARGAREAQGTRNARGTRKRRTLCVMSVILTLAMVFGLIPNLTPSETFAAPTPTVSKTAEVLNGGVKGNGSAEAPIEVELDDEIQYTITVDMQNPPPPQPRYDVLFVLDWSASMNAAYGRKQTDEEIAAGYPESARVLAKETIEELSARVFRDYPDSRIALMGLNSNARTSGFVGNTNVQVNTDFVGPSSYEAVITKAFSKAPELKLDDCPTFMQAAIDKLYGPSGKRYGGLDSPYAGGAKAPRTWVEPRSDKTRIPLVVFISDFQFGLGSFGSGPVGSAPGGNWGDFTNQAERFKSLYPEGIFLGARTDHYENTNVHGDIFATPAHDRKMQETFDDVNGDQWGWVKFTAGQQQWQRDDALYNLIKVKAPPPPLAVTIIDKLPAGLEYVSSSPVGIKSTEDGRDQVRWENPSFTGPVTVTVTAKVKKPGLFVNEGTVRVNDEGVIKEYTTNPTYHKTDEVPPQITASKTARVTTSEVRDPGSAEAPVSVKVGDKVEYIISVTNSGSSAVEGVTIMDVLPDGMIYESCSSPGIKYLNGAMWPTYDLQPGTTEFKIYALVSTSGLFVNSATIAPQGVADFETNKTYHQAGEVEDPVFKLHLRQIILERSDNSVELPPRGYMQLTNGTTVNSVMTESGLHGLGETDFTEFIVAISKTDPICKVTDILPQYFEYAGYVATNSAVVHDPASRQSGEIALDSSAHSEYWVTVYLKPKLTVPGDYTWDFRTNHFGEIA